jgi:cytochrome c
MARAIWALAMAAGLLAACGGDDDGGGSAPAPRAELTPEQRTAVLTSLPAPYNAADLENGRQRFAQCRSCHTLVEGGPNLVGPNLYGMFGRRIASKEGYSYSEAAKGADFVWDGPRLDRWLADPRGFLQGTKMAFPGIKAEQDRRDVIAYVMVETGYRPTAAPAP